LFQKWLGKPPRSARRAAVADRIVLPAGAGDQVCFGFDSLLPRRRQLGGVRSSVRRQIGIELQTAFGAGVDARPVIRWFSHLLPARGLAAARRVLERVVERLGGLES